MNLNPFRRHKTDTTVPPELEPYYGTDSAALSRSWLYWALRMVILAAIIVLIVLAALWNWHRENTHTSNTTPPSKSQANQPPSQNNVPKPSSKPAPTPASNSTNNGAVQPPSSTLPNTGG